MDLSDSEEESGACGGQGGQGGGGEGGGGGGGAGGKGEGGGAGEDGDMGRSSRGRVGAELGVNKKGTPLYSREDIREQYCINDKELQVLDKSQKKSLLGCFSNQGQVRHVRTNVYELIRIIFTVGLSEKYKPQIQVTPSTLETKE